MLIIAQTVGLSAVCYALAIGFVLYLDKLINKTDK